MGIFRYIETEEGEKFSPFPTHWPPSQVCPPRNSSGSSSEIKGYCGIGLENLPEVSSQSFKSEAGESFVQDLRQAYV